MADISQVKLPNGDTYNLVDETSGYLKSEDVDLDNYVPKSITIDDTSFYYTIRSDHPFSSLAQIEITLLDTNDKGGIIQLARSSSGDGYIIIRGSDRTEVYNVITPTSDDMAANKKYVDDSIPQVYSSTNTGGYLTMATLPIYDGTVV